MKHRRTFIWIGLLVLSLIIGIRTEAFSAQQYRVKKGDTLVSIAKRYGISVKSLKQANRLQSSDLKLKQALVIPADKSKSSRNRKVASSKSKSDKKPKVVSSTAGKEKGNSYYTVKKGDTLYKISKEKGISVSKLKAMNHLRGTALKVGRKLIVAKAAIPKSRPVQEQSEPLPNVEAVDVKPIEEDLAPMTEQEWDEITKDQGKNSECLGKWRSTKERQLLVKVALGFIGAPYRTGGDTVRGLDSSGFVQKIYEIFDVNLPRTALEQSRLGKKVDRMELQEGDLVFFYDRRSAGVVGIYIGNNKFVHAASDGKREVRIGYLNDPNSEKNFIKAVRLKTLENGG